MMVLGLLCCTQAFSNCSEWGASLVVGHGLLTGGSFSYCGARVLDGYLAWADRDSVSIVWFLFEWIT